MTRYTKREIVTFDRNTGSSRNPTPLTVYAIRRIRLEGWFRPKKFAEYLKLRNMDSGHVWEDRGNSEDSFYYNFTVERPETIIEKWNHQPKTDQERFDEKYGKPVELMHLTTRTQIDEEFGDSEEENDNRLARLGSRN